MLKMKITYIPELARQIVARLREESKPGCCTWGDAFPEAHYELFTTYSNDMASTIEDMLAKFVN